MTPHLNVKPPIDRLCHSAVGLLNVEIKASAQDGKANAYLVEFLAKQFDVAKSSVTIVAGFTNQHRGVEINADKSMIEAASERLA